MPNSYRRDRSYLWNYKNGPQLPDEAPSVPETPRKDFFGFSVASRFGIAAGILLNSRWVERYARWGFDLLTYKSVRSAARPCYPLPNWVYVDLPPEGLGAADADVPLVVSARAPRDPLRTTSSVCFGMPSMPPEEWARDVGRAKAALGAGQVLIVSVVGTPGDGGFDALVADYVDCARRAAAAGADIVEANYSCPNVCSAEGSIYQSAESSGLLTLALRDALPSTPLLIKAGHFADPKRLEAFYRAVDGAADGVVIVNGVARRVHTADGLPAFPGHERAGIIGCGVGEPALDNVRGAVECSRRLGLNVQTLAVGGVLRAEDAGPFFAAGAAAVFVGGGAALRPELAVELKTTRPDW